MSSGRERDARRTRVVIADRTVCHHCKRTGLTEAGVFCPRCGFPQGGTEQAQYRFIVSKRKVRSDIADNQRMLGYARWLLWVAAVVNGFTFSGSAGLVLGGGGLVSLTFIALSVWVKKEPFAALLTALIVYVSLQLFIAIFDPMFIIHGLVFKIIIASGFVYGMYAAKAVERLKKQL